MNDHPPPGEKSPPLEIPAADKKALEPPSGNQPEGAAQKPEKQPSPSVPPVNEKKPRKALWISTVIFLLCGVAFLIYWIGWGQYRAGTNDAYVNGNMIMVTPQIEGIVTTLLVDNTQQVEEGQPILELDRHDNEIALEKAQADLADAVRQVVQLFYKVEELHAKKEVNHADFVRAGLDFEHRQALVGDGSVSREDFEHSETTLYATYSALIETEKEFEGALAEVENTSVDTHPKVEQMKSAVRKAFLALHRCTVLAPARGIITQRRAQVGQHVKASDALMALVPIEQMWIDANLREVNLKHLRIGQPVTMFSDMYGRRLKFHGKVVGLNPGTGSVFSILPPQNATGNWIKIVQRVPVKISLDPEELQKNPLVLGLSMTVTVDTHDRSGLQLPHTFPTEPIYSSNVYDDELDGVEEMIDRIIAENMPEE